MENQKGITLVTLVVTIIIMLILAGVGIKMGFDAGEKTKLENIKLNMSTIKSKAKIIAEKNSYDATNNPLLGVAIAEATDYTIPEGLQNLLQKQEDGELKYKQCYVWEAQNLKDQGMNISISKTRFYIIDYHTCEIFYSEGYNGIYNLTELNNIKYSVKSTD